jgi:hypothetical protein
MRREYQQYQRNHLIGPGMIYKGLGRRVYIQDGAMNRGLKWFFFSKNRPSSRIEAFGSPEKGLLLFVDLSRTDLFNIAAIFRHDGLPVAAERAAGRRPATSGSIAW